MKINVKQWQVTVAAVGMICILGVVPREGIALDYQPVVFSPKKAVVGLTYGSWSAAWWQYVLSIPSSNNPLNDDGSDTTGGVCGVGQLAGPVFFLAGSFVGSATRQCTVPAVPLFIPIINAECSDVEDPPFFGSNAQERRVCAAKLIDGVDVDGLEVTVDGKSLPSLGYFRAQSPDFKFTLPDMDNILGLENVTSGNAVSDGYYVMLRPLSPGNHVIQVKGACVSGDCAGFSQDVTYELTVAGDDDDTNGGDEDADNQ